MSALKPAAPKKLYEGDYLFMKSYVCPVCENRLRIPTVKAGKARILSQDWDLRPVHKDIDVQKYDVVHCNKCGFAILKRYFGVLPKPHKELILEKISKKYDPHPEPVGMVRSYEEALTEYKLALLCAAIRQVHDSEVGLLTLKIAWLYRAQKLALGDDTESFTKAVRLKYDGFLDAEEKYLKKAMDCLLKARQTEEPPIAGMNETAIDFLLASLCGHFGKFDDAARLVSGILQSKQSSPSQKDRARDMLDAFRDKRDNV